MIVNQGILFLIYITTGILIGLIFDLFRSLRKSIKTSNIATYIEDILFWTIVGFIIINIILKFNYGELRLYIFIGIIIGATIYFLTLSKIIVKYTAIFFKFLINIFCKVKTVFLKIFGKPIKFIIINLKELPRKKKRKEKNKNLSKIV